MGYDLYNALDFRAATYQSLCCWEDSLDDAQRMIEIQPGNWQVSLVSSFG